MEAPHAPTLRPDLERVVERLLAASEDGRTVSIDAIGEALGVTPATGDEIDRVFTALERAGRAIVAPSGVDLPGRLRRVLAATRELTAGLGRKPHLAELAEATGLSHAEVRHALSFGQILGR